MEKEVTIYTDGGCEPNPGPGGYGVVLIYGKLRKELSGGYRLTTNNRMELLAVIKGLEALKEPCIVKVFSDSEYVVNGMTLGWVARWKARGWYRKKNQLVANHDLWKRLDALCQQHQVEFHWVKGHADIPENERCDRLAMQALSAEDLQIDELYESTSDLNPQTFLQVNKARRDYQAQPAKVKITAEGQPCRKCGTPVIKKTPKKKNSSGKTYFYEYYFYCPKCRTMYMVEEAKRYPNE
ncbi:MAG: ribonuclease HI [Anaerolineales bacterium]|nr:ribonuclease HI [Anaerolineales bacterium]